MRPLTRSCFLLLVLGRLFLLALPFLLEICFRSRWSPPFPLHALALIPLTLAKVRLSPTLTLSPLMIWYFGLTALFLFVLAKVTPVFLPTALPVALRPLFPFRQAQYAQVFSLKPAPFCTLFAGLGSTNKFAISLLLSDSRSVLAALSSPPSFLFISNSVADLAGTVFSLLTFYQATIGPRTLVTPGKRREALLAPSTIPCSLSPLISDWRRTVSSKFFDAQVPSISTEELVLPRHARCVLSRLRCNGHSLLLGSYLSRIGRIEILPAAPVDTRPRTPLISFFTVQLRTLCAAHFLAIFCLYDLWSRPRGVARLLGRPWSSALPPSLGRGRVNNNNKS